MSRKYPIGIQSFSEVRQGDYLYVDKTQRIFELVTHGKHFFLSRPRRFGKSLLLSTLKHLFQGDKELFEGLWIEDQWDWAEQHPVLHISFSSLGYKDLGLTEAIEAFLDQAAREFEVELPPKGVSVKFKALIRALASRKRVVLLIDEYDKPLIDYIEEPEMAEKNRAVLKNFYSVLKDSDPYLRLVFITGVSKFSRVSIFSDLNNLEDLTLSSLYDDICGYTQQELETYFEDEIVEMAEKQGMSLPAFHEKIRSWYNGYNWTGEHTLYNPFSILNFVKQKRFNNFWWETGTPTFLMQRLKKRFQYELENYMGGTDLFESYTLGSEDNVSLLFQTGYLTIKDVNEELRLYTLGYPNLEVKDAMYRHLLGAFRHTTTSESQRIFAMMKLALDRKDLAAFVEQVNILFSSVPYQIFIQHQEAYFHSLLHITFHAVGLFIHSEVSTSAGRVDCVLENDDYLYLLELKLDGSAESALAQIRDKAYGQPYLGKGKEVLAVGINFSSESKSVADWKMVPYEELG